VFCPGCYNSWRIVQCRVQIACADNLLRCCRWLYYLFASMREAVGYWFLSSGWIDINDIVGFPHLPVARTDNRAEVQFLQSCCQQVVEHVDKHDLIHVLRFWQRPPAVDPATVHTYGPTAWLIIGDASPANPLRRPSFPSDNNFVLVRSQIALCVVLCL